jgi:glutamyl/glutaminyl-tRNA synthetase
LEQLAPIAAMVQERAQRLDQVPELVAFAFAEPAPDADFLRGKLEAGVARSFLEQVPQLLGDEAQLVERLRELAITTLANEPETQKRRLREAMRVVRVAITGAEISPPLPASIALIGEAVARERIERALEMLRRAEVGTSLELQP